MLDFICMGPVDLLGAHQKRQNTKWKILAHSGTRTHKPEVWSMMLYRLSYPGLLKAVYFNDHISYMYFQYQCIHCYKFEIDEAERILSWKWTVLCYILEYISILYKCKETHKSWICLQHANTTKHSTWSGICMLKASTGLMDLCTKVI